jgi:hypothetical protein
VDQSINQTYYRIRILRQLKVTAVRYLTCRLRQATKAATLCNQSIKHGVAIRGDRH